MASSTMKSGLDLLSAAVNCINNPSTAHHIAQQTSSASQASAQLMKAFQDAQSSAGIHSSLPSRQHSIVSVSAHSSSTNCRSASEDEDDAGSSNSSNSSASARPTGNALPLKKRLKMTRSFADAPSTITANSSNYSCVSSAKSFVANTASHGAAPSFAFVHTVTMPHNHQQTLPFDCSSRHNNNNNNKRVATSQEIVDDNGHQVGMGYFDPAGTGRQINDARSVSTNCSVVSDRTSSTSSSRTSCKSSRSSRSNKSTHRTKQQKQQGQQRSVVEKEEGVAQAVTVWQRQLQENFQKEMASTKSKQIIRPQTQSSVASPRSRAATVSPQESSATSPCCPKQLPPSDEMKKLWQNQLQDNFNKEVKARALAELKKNCSAVASAFLPPPSSDTTFASSGGSGSSSHANNIKQRAIPCSTQQQHCRRNSQSQYATNVMPTGTSVMSTSQEDQMKKLYQAYVSAVRRN
mmetsp:Transcript_15653/g.32701  ORF Transcript_15653/g.32701 Transcript_15653/m.32701 type:complete len:463 (-) Transcript_15653:248-1636(-)